MLKVVLSPFYVKEQFVDEVSGITFERASISSSMQLYDVSNVEDMSGIRKAIRLNVLQIIEGEIENGQIDSSSKPSEGSLSDVPSEPERASDDSVQATGSDQEGRQVSDEVAEAPAEEAAKASKPKSHKK